MAALGGRRGSPQPLLLPPPPPLLLLLLLLTPLGVRAVPEEDAGSRNKEPPAPPQQLQPQPAEAQGPDAARAEVRLGRAWGLAGLGALGVPRERGGGRDASAA